MCFARCYLHHVFFVMLCSSLFFFFFFFNDTATTEIYTLSLHDALPICSQLHTLYATVENIEREVVAADLVIGAVRSEEHTSELQSRLHLVCRLLLEKKKKNQIKRLDLLSDDDQSNSC